MQILYWNYSLFSLLMQQKKRALTSECSLLLSAGEGTRTPTRSPPADFESAASAYSATPAHLKANIIVPHILHKVKYFFTVFSNTLPHSSLACDTQVRYNVHNY